MLEWQPPGISTLFLAVSEHSSHHRVFKLEQTTIYADKFNGSDETHIDAYYNTRWFDPTKPAQRKRFRRPEFVMDADATATLDVKVYKNFDDSVVVRSFPLAVTAITGGNWGDDWGTLIWSSDTSSGVQKLVRGLGLGTGKAVKMRIDGPDTNVPWGINSISIPYLLKRVR
jgi:hypothetical protein